MLCLAVVANDINAALRLTGRPTIWSERSQAVTAESHSVTGGCRVVSSHILYARELELSSWCGDCCQSAMARRGSLDPHGLLTHPRGANESAGLR
ncbi:hypothetical protein PI126_g9846 [Phytophthora idaei]|nr:hypothetical protein PI126_g9846 [Phytophthora idaei]